MPTDSTESVFVGVDTHADTPHVAVVGNLGRHLDDREFPTDPGGYRRLLDWVRSAGSVAAVGVEGTGAYGAQLARCSPQRVWWSSRSTGPTIAAALKLTASPTLLTPMLQLKQWRPAEPTAPQNPETDCRIHPLPSGRSTVSGAGKDPVHQPDSRSTRHPTRRVA